MVQTGLALPLIFLLAVLFGHFLIPEPPYQGSAIKTIYLALQTKKMSNQD